MDYMKQERERGITITSAAITFGWKNHRINLIDTPGHVDFTIEVERSIRVLDGAVTILDGVSGVEAQTQTVWAQADKYGIPRIAYVNKMDRIGAGFGRTVKEMHHKLGTRPLVCQLPIMKKDSKGNGLFFGVVDLLDMQVLDWNKDPNGSIINKIPLTEKYPISELFEEAIKGRSSLIEALSEIDDQLLEIFLMNEDPMKVSVEEIKEALRRVTLNGKAVPVFCGASFKNVGVQPLMDAVIDYLPSPLDRPAPLATLSDKNLIEIPLKEKEKLCALAFKVIHDHKRGPMIFVRVYSGKIDNRMTLFNTNTRKKERVNKLLQMYANDVEEIPSITAGNIGVILGLKETRTGDTLIQINDSRQNLKLQSIDIPSPVFFYAVEPTSVSDEKPLEEALKNILREDPSLHVHVDSDSGQTLISGMGELHLEIIKDRLLTEFKVNAEMGKMRISYRETIIVEQLEHTFLYDRELMGKKQKAQVSLIITPLSENDKGIPEEGGNRIVIDIEDKIVNLNSDQQNETNDQNSLITKLDKEEIRDSLHSGILSALYRGPILGFPITGLHIKVHSLKLFGLESTKTAISACVSQAFSEAMKNGVPVLLEPLMDVQVEVPEEHLGNVLADLTGTRRGNILGLETSGQSIDYDHSIEIYTPPDPTYISSDENQGAIIKRIIKAHVPLSTLLGYSSSLRSLTGGTGSFSMRIHSFGIMSEDRAKSVINEMQGGY
ncbi:P-loop containing nucleoside triphosphate hydrolase protein [Glomus cerebriforme]|uniref:Elongation factor 2 n=1 Tax=Glomus cerebriforme TaxID=658196 RepID=A0A397TEB1_9GLOM|nr:P-loop containing nucleoside triphosphate hydrolase protein [Glomus cerebriforme]